MKNERKLILSIILLSIVGSTFGSAISTEPTYGEISLSPSAPTALSTVSLSLNMSGGVPSEIYIIVQECNGGTGICYPDKLNVTMSETSTGHYQGSGTLKHDDATYITCTAYGKTPTGWSHSVEKKVNLSKEPNNGNGTDDDKKSPGFEVIILVAAIGISLIMLGRKRIR
jgi:hypothetical protein